MNNCRAINSQFTWEEISPDLNPFEFEKLRSEYSLPERFGLLVVYGTPPNATHQFIESKDLVASSSAGDRERSFDFKGEEQLLNALIDLSHGKAKAVVYFTQGSGELDFNERARNRPDSGVGELQDELTKINYQPRALDLGPKTTSIPDDADILVIAGPREEMAPNVVKALRDFLKGEHRKDKKKGRLIVLFDVAIRKGQMLHTGLEALVAEYGVKVGDNRLLSIRGRDPREMHVIPDPRSPNPIPRAFLQGGATTVPTFLISDARTVEASSQPGGAFTTENVIVTVPQFYNWTETDLKADPYALAAEMRGDLEKLRAKLNDRSLPVGIAVTEGKAAAPPMPGHPPLTSEGEPRLIVFGDASWISNQIMPRNTPENFALFSSCLSWLAGRRDIGERIPPGSRNLYKLKAAPGEGWNLIFLPGVLLLFGVVSLGFGVWVVRRR
jgi:hypothetical protein